MGRKKIAGQRAKIVTVLYAVLHFLVDGLCILALYQYLTPGAEKDIYLIYNFCAFALQLPIGYLLDRLLMYRKSFRSFCFYFAAAGAFLTVSGAFVSPILLGIGNAFFHIGGGCETILTNREKKRTYAGPLGIFVAPGALGLFLYGSASGVFSAGRISFLFYGTVLCMAAILLSLWILSGGEQNRGTVPEPGNGAGESRESIFTGNRMAACAEGKTIFSGKPIMVLLICFLVVIMRSYSGTISVFPWKTGFEAGLAAALALVSGKACGGYLAELFGSVKMVSVSLLTAAAAYLLSSWMPAGICALFLFNMTMPVTLFFAAEEMPNHTGTAFGLLTLGLFLGYALVKAGIFFGDGTWYSLLTLFLLLPVLSLRQKAAGSKNPGKDV